MKKSGNSEAWMTELVTENTTCQAPWAWNVPQILLFCRFKLDEKFVPFNPSQHKHSSGIYLPLCTSYSQTLGSYIKYVYLLEFWGIALR